MKYPMLPILARLTERDIEKFWSLVEKRGPDECWRFRSINRITGYGIFIVRRRGVAAHRVAWCLHNNEELGSRIACHSCDNRWCVNPAHIWAGTHELNNRDTAAKGRHRNGTAYVEWNGAQRAKRIEGIPARLRSSVAAKNYEAELQQRAKPRERKGKKP